MYLNKMALQTFNEYLIEVQKQIGLEPNEVTSLKHIPFKLIMRDIIATKSLRPILVCLLLLFTFTLGII